MRRLVRCAFVLSGFMAACSSLPLVGRSAPERWAFTAPWDARSAASVRAHASQLDALVLNWIALDSVTGLPLDLYRDTVPAVVGRRMSLVTTFTGRDFHPALVRRLAMDSLLLKRSATAIADRMQRDNRRGLVIDFEGMTSADTALTRAVVATIAGAVRARGFGPVTVAIPATDTSGYPARLFDTSADFLLVMLYDQHSATSPAGPVAEPGWVRRSLALRVAESGASRLVAGLPLYGYVWRPNTPVATAISYDDARKLTTEAGVALERDPSTMTLRAQRADSERWELWVTDAVLLAELERVARALNVTKVAYWRLGFEDPAMWR